MDAIEEQADVDNMRETCIDMDAMLCELKALHTYYLQQGNWSQE